MSSRLISIAGLAAVLTLGTFISACQDLHQKKASELAPTLSVRVVFPDRAEAAAAGPDAPVPVPTPGDTQYYIRLTISNPMEVRYLFDYVPGTIVDVVVASGVQRVISVDGWVVSSAPPAPGMLSGQHFITTTPQADRTVNFLGEPVSIVLAMGPDPDLGAINANPPYVVQTGAGDVVLPASANCPAADGYHLTVTNLDWPVVFPTVSADLYPGGVPSPFSLGGLALGMTYSLTLWHDETGIVSEDVVTLTSPSQTIDLVFSGYLNPAITFSPGNLAGLVPVSVQTVNFGLAGGWGGLTSPSVGPLDTCGGSVSGGQYTFTVPYSGSSCVIDVAAVDCSGSPVDNTLVAGIDLGLLPSCIDYDHDGYVAVAHPWCAPLDCDDNDPNNQTSCATCVDADGDHWFSGCDAYVTINGPDCNDADPNNWQSCMSCGDSDADGWYSGCDAYLTLIGPDCNDGDPNNWLACSTCVDNDGDMWSVGCDAYVTLSGPDCNDADPDNWNACAACVDNDADSWFVGCNIYTTRNGPDCNDADHDNWASCAFCLDADADSWFDGCDAYTTRNGPDCNDADPDNWTACAACVDNDADFWFVGCNAYTFHNGPDCNDASPNNWNACASCVDNDADGWHFGCNAYVTINGPDCNDADPDNWNSCATCMDVDGDGWHFGCNAFTTRIGPDCNDGDVDNWSSCATCADNDGDGWFVGCNAFTIRLGPDCSDTNGGKWDDCGTWYVVPGGAGAQDGNHWWSAFAHPEDALAVSAPGERVFVAQGTYTSLLGGVNPVLTMAGNISIYGGFTGVESGLTARSANPIANATILDGLNQSTHVVTAASNARLDGFIIQNGRAMGAAWLDKRGAGFDSRNVSNITVANCWFRNNRSDEYGGALQLENATNNVFDQDIFSNNQAGLAYTGSYGGVAVLRASYTPNSFSSTFHNCLFFANRTATAFGSGGAIANLATSLVTVQNSTFANNIATGSGGAFYQWNTGTTNISNSILWNNAGGASPAFDLAGGSANITYSDVQGGWAGTGNLNVNPLFTPSFRLSQTAAGNFINSPLIEAGSNTAANLGLSAFSTRTDGVADAGQVDLGFHYPAGTTESLIPACLAAATGDNTTGLTWATAFTNPQTCINAAVAGTDVWVKQGTYTSLLGGTNPVVTMKAGVDLYGGFAGAETTLAMRGDPTAFPTILDGQNQSDHVVVGASTAAFDGFVVQNGNAADRGGGMYLNNCSNLTIANSTIRNNQALNYGGGMYIGGGAGIAITNCTVINNQSTQPGFYGLGGGAGAMIQSSSPLITNSSFSNNIGAGVGAGIFNSSASPVITNCLFTGNSSDQMGAAFENNGSSPLLTNCTIADNYAPMYGRAMDASNNSHPVLRNCIIWNNSGGTPTFMDQTGGLTTITYSDVQDGWAGTGNTNVNPLFMAGPHGNYYLTPGSQCIDTGDNTAAFYGLDTRTTQSTIVPDNGIVDRGFHYQIP